MECTSAAGAMPPRNPWRSTSSVRAPMRAEATAAASPALPPPATRTSHSMKEIGAFFTEQILEGLIQQEAQFFVAEASIAPGYRHIHAPAALAEKEAGPGRRAQTGEMIR